LEVTATAVKELRDKTNAGMMDCKKALLDTHGDMERAIDLLRQKGLAKALKRAGKETSEGMVHSYIHAGGRLGVLLEVNCETDFAAKSEDFAEFVKNVAMHVAASNPLGVQREDIPPDILQRERDIYLAQARETGKPENILEKMVDGKMRKFFEESVLLEQRYIKDTDKTIQDYLNELVAKIGEKIIIRRYARFQLGGE
jgi:elongation factor Ts